MIRIEGLSARPSTKGSSALDEVSLSLPAREVVALVGSRGAGKAALLNVLSGEQRSKGGDLFLDGEAITPKAPRWRQDVLLVPHKLKLPKAGSIWGWFQRELAAPRSVRSKVTPLERAEAMLKKLKLWELAQGAFGDVSEAEGWRLSIAQGLLRSPRCLLLEESSRFSAEDVAETVACLRPFAESGTTIVVPASRDMPSGDFDHVVVLDAGRILAKGSPQTLTDTHKLPPQISIPRVAQSEALVEETIGEGFVWADGPRETFVSALPEDVTAEDFFRMVREQGIEPDFVTLQTPSLGQLYMALTQRSLEEDALAH